MEEGRSALQRLPCWISCSTMRSGCCWAIFVPRVYITFEFILNQLLSENSASWIQGKCVFARSSGSPITRSTDVCARLFVRRLLSVPNRILPDEPTNGRFPAGLDACQTLEHGCQHQCVSAADSYVCRCSEGFLLEEDGKRCKSRS